MNKLKLSLATSVLGIILFLSSCSIPKVEQREANTTVPESFSNSLDTNSAAKTNWREFFTDQNLINLIDSALVNNQELNIMMKEIMISSNEVMARQGEYLPSARVNAGAGAEKVGRYTSQGANDANTEISDGHEFPEPLTDFMLTADVSWELDVWNKLHNATDAAAKRYLSSIEGKNYMVTQLIAEIANSYYELEALDNQLQILQDNIEIQQNALRTVKLQKEAGKVTELAVKKFEAEVLKNRSLIFNIKQDITVTENRINFLLGRYPQKIVRSSDEFTTIIPKAMSTGVPSELLQNRPDIKQAELELEANKLDVKSARANFYPAFRITGSIGYQSYNTGSLFQTPESMLYGLVGDMVMPLLNRNAIEAQYLNANYSQMQSVYNLERTILNAYVEVANQLSNMENLQNSYQMKSEQVDALMQSTSIASSLFNSARADYMEVMLTQRDVLDARFELIENKMKQLNSFVKLYKALGGGWDAN
jgi:NodT family efflux transporter outer membrane factor (OMF) lipoprotein